MLDWDRKDLIQAIEDNQGEIQLPLSPVAARTSYAIIASVILADWKILSNGSSLASSSMRPPGVKVFSFTGYSTRSLLLRINELVASLQFHASVRGTWEVAIRWE